MENPCEMPAARLTTTLCKDILDIVKANSVVGARALRALAHPFRLRLYELVSREGTLTTTRAAALTHESTANCSFHLRQLAKYGFIEEAPAPNQRERPWRRTNAVNRFAGRGTVAEQLAAEVAITRVLEQARHFLAQPAAHPKEWQDATFLHDALLYLLPAELAAVRRQVLELTAPYITRTAQPALRPAGSRPVSLLAVAVPLRLTDSGN